MLISSVLSLLTGWPKDHRVVFSPLILCPLYSAYLPFELPYDTRMRLLLVEDDHRIVRFVARGLQEQSYAVDVAANGNDALYQVEINDYDLVILDVMIPGKNGFEVCKAIRALGKRMPILMLTARDAVEDRITGLDSGADDYLVKPFHLAELNARIKSLIRRTLFKGGNTITFNEIQVKTDEHQVYINDNLLELTRKEFDLLLFMITNKGRVLSKESIAEHLWGDYIDSADSFGFVYAHIKNLRKKLEDNGVGNYLQTVYGVGYKFIEP